MPPPTSHPPRVCSCCVRSVALSWARSAGVVTGVRVAAGSLPPSSCTATEWTRSDSSTRRRDSFSAITTILSCYLMSGHK